MKTFLEIAKARKESKVNREAIVGFMSEFNSASDYGLTLSVDYGINNTGETQAFELDLWNRTGSLVIDRINVYVNDSIIEDTNGVKGEITKSIHINDGLEARIACIGTGDWYYVEWTNGDYNLHIVKNEDAEDLGINKPGQVWVYTQVV